MTTLAFALSGSAGAAEAASDSMNPWLGLALGLLLVAINGFFVAAEFALVKVRPTQLDPLAQAGSRRAKLARHQLTHLDAYLSACQLGITIASLALGWVGDHLLSPEELCHLPSLTQRAQAAALFLHRVAAGEIPLPARG